MGYNFMIDFFLRLVEPLFPYTFDPLLKPLLAVSSPGTGALLTVAAISVGLSAMLMVLKYFLMDKDKYEEVKNRRKDLNKKMKEAQKEDNPEETSEHMQEMMALQKDMFMSQMKPMIVSMLIFFIILPWMYVTFTPIVDLSPADDGTYTGMMEYNGYETEITVINESDEPIVVVDGEEHDIGDRFQMEDLDWRIGNADLENDETIRFTAIILNLPFSLPLVGDTLGWFGTYFLFIIPSSLIFGKLLGIT